MSALRTLLGPSFFALEFIACIATAFAGDWPPPSSVFSPTWNRPEVIRAAAQKIATVHRSQGVKAAYDQIHSCYGTQALAVSYGEGLEACIAQDYVESKVLSEFIALMTPAVRKQLGLETPEQILEAMGRRISEALAKYPLPFPFLSELKDSIEVNGITAYTAIVFPEDAAK